MIELRPYYTNITPDFTPKVETDRTDEKVVTTPLIDTKETSYSDNADLAAHKAMFAPVVAELNYRAAVQNLINEILALQVRLSEKNRHQTEDLKNAYRAAYTDAANLTERLGSTNLRFAGLGLLCSLCYLSPYASDREIGGIFAQQFVPKFGEMWASTSQADMRKKDALAQMLITEFSNQASKGQNDASSRQEFIGILEKLFESLRQAARAN